MERLVNEGQTQVVEQFQQLLQNKSWILGSVGVDDELMRDWSSKFHSNLLVMQPHVTANLDFKTYLLDKLTVIICTMSCCSQFLLHAKRLLTIQMQFYAKVCKIMASL